MGNTAGTKASTSIKATFKMIQGMAMANSLQRVNCSTKESGSMERESKSIKIRILISKVW